MRRLRHISIELACALVLMIAALVLGGGSSKPTHEILLVIIAATGLLATTWASRKERVPAMGLRWLVGLVVGVVCLQLLPLPTEWIAARSIGAQFVDRLLGLNDWRPIALSPDATLYALLCLMPAFVMMWFVAVLDYDERRTVIAWLLAATAIVGVIGFAQATDAISFTFYNVTHRHVAVGFFASRNNFADLIILTTPLAFAMHPVWERRYGKGTATFVLHAFLVVNLFAIIASASRAGVIIVSAVLFVSYYSHMPSRLRPRYLAIVAIGIGAGVAIFMFLPLTGALKVVAERFSGEEDARWDIWKNSWRAVTAYWPQGAGLGNFRLAYEQVEPRLSVTPSYINAAHNEYLQFAIEFGLIGTLLLLLVMLYTIKQVYSNRTDALAVFACIGLAGIMAHAVVDYPFRIIGINLLIALLATLCVTPADRPHGRLRSSQPAVDARR